MNARQVRTFNIDKYVRRLYWFVYIHIYVRVYVYTVHMPKYYLPAHYLNTCHTHTSFMAAIVWQEIKGPTLITTHHFARARNL